MRFLFDQQSCQNIRRSLRREWLETNGLGDYASSTLIGCNTRKYHGLLVAELSSPPGRHVLLSTLEESFMAGGRECFLSCRKHPDVFYPRGHEYLEEVEIGPWPRFTYRFGDVRIVREIMLVPGRRLTIIRYSLNVDDTGVPLPGVPQLRIKPLLAFRNAHDLTRANMALQVKTWPAPSGFGIRPYNCLPAFYMQLSGVFTFHPSPEWCRNVRYPVEAARGFADEEDLFQPGVLDVALAPGCPVYLSASTEVIEAPGTILPELWSTEAARRTAIEARGEAAKPSAERPGVLEAHLSREAGHFRVRDAQGEPSVTAGYHWFGMWGRDTCIALPGLTFYAGRPKDGVALLLRLGRSARNGLIPNVFSPDGKHSYNSVDASLWYLWAMQQMLLMVPETDILVREHCWPVVKAIIRAYRTGAVPFVHEDEDGLLHVGTPETQLTWMDATVDGHPVTPRYGCPVEINALWYNALAFARELGRRYGEPEWSGTEPLDRFRKTFRQRFWVASRGGYLADVWRPGEQDRSLRPNQIFAASLPYSVLHEDDWPFVVEAVRDALLTPFGLRTLSPEEPGYRPVYEGGPASRDSAYHQGTVWPWLLGAYTEALLRTAWDTENAVAEYLELLTPLFAEHLPAVGIGNLSEIFGGDPPHKPDGCIAQAWSVAETLRSLYLLRRAAPGVYASWEAALLARLESVVSGAETWRVRR